MNPIAPGQDATLKSLTPSAGKVSPGFYGARKQFYLYLPHAVDSVSLTPVATNARATATIHGQRLGSGQATSPISLEVGRNPLAIEVTAEDGITKNDYSLRIIRRYPTPTWIRLKEKCPWTPRDSAGELVFQDALWLFGGYTPELVSDVWRSGDGLEWTRVGEIPSPSGVNIPAVWAYDDRMWVVSQDGVLFASTNGSQWSRVADQGPWKGRYSAGAVVFRDRMWLLGGSGGPAFNDVWSSTDGVNWRPETPEAPWSRRQLFSMVVAHDDRMWVLGGGLTVYHPFRAYTDVWNTEDGRRWTQVAEAAPWPARIWSSAAVYRGRMWILGGFRAEPTWNNFDDLWYSEDGAVWHPLASECLWSPRHEVSAYVFRDRLWLFGGNAWPLMNDAWSLHIPGFCFVTQPVIEEFATAQYTYRARADFNASRQKVRYRLIEGPNWLKLDVETGVLRGTPPAPQDVRVTIEAFDAAGELVRQSYTLHVLGN
ncbi:MAG: cadherin-like beta sandwich domain-containing protein [Planctomycetes bacterium]|nr:cadherin-like beta sandwich domain-containing protein [Planctomycetota bacterium]